MNIVLCCYGFCVTEQEVRLVIVIVVEMAVVIVVHNGNVAVVAVGNASVKDNIVFGVNAAMTIAPRLLELTGEGRVLVLVNW